LDERGALIMNYFGAFALGIFVAQWLAALRPRAAGSPWLGTSLLAAYVVIRSSFEVGIWAGAVVLLALIGLAATARRRTT
jgi:hypothetical protein